MTPFVRRLKVAATGRADVRFVYLHNFEAEREWSLGEPRLPGSAISLTDAIVKRIEEIGVFLGEPGDVVVLKGRPDARFLAHARRAVPGLPRVVAAASTSPTATVTADVLASPRVLAELAALADGSTYLLPLGTTADAERLSELTGLPLATAPVAAVKRVNGKDYSRTVSLELGIRTVPGTHARELEELDGFARPRLVAGSPVVVKEPYGVSGRGMTVLRDVEQLDRLLRMLARKSDQGVSFVVEDWLDVVGNLNYQVLVGADGAVDLVGVREATVVGGVHGGHVSPAVLPDAARAELERAAQSLGERLSADGYRGLFGVDAMTTADGTFYPCVEINARLNMATYQNVLEEHLGRPGEVMVASSTQVELGRRPGADEVLAIVEAPDDGTVTVLQSLATVTAADPGDGRAFVGRFYLLTFGADREVVARRVEQLHAALQRLGAARLDGRDAA